jgi:hypothetical protein
VFNTDMPQRFLKPGITNSDRWNSVSWQAQSLYIRLLTVVDDYGRYDGRTAVIHGACFSVYNAIHPECVVKLQETDKMLQEIAASLLVELYDSQGKRVMQITQWTERLREGVKERWPARNSGELLQLPADSCKNNAFPSPSPSPSLSSSSSIGGDPPNPEIMEGKEIKPGMRIPPDPLDALNYGQKIGLTEDAVNGFMDYHQAAGWRLKSGKMKDWQAALRTWKRTGKLYGRNGKPQVNHRNLAMGVTPEKSKAMGLQGVAKVKQMAAAQPTLQGIQ